MVRWFHPSVCISLQYHVSRDQKFSGLSSSCASFSISTSMISGMRCLRKWPTRASTMLRSCQKRPCKLSTTTGPSRSARVTVPVMPTDSSNNCKSSDRASSSTASMFSSVSSSSTNAIFAVRRTALGAGHLSWGMGRVLRGANRDAVKGVLAHSELNPNPCLEEESTCIIAPCALAVFVQPCKRSVIMVFAIKYSWNVNAEYSKPNALK
mmetsp:Transcript_39128/g.74986  ORF Transcript_39128/g.74986 Transcript_39128/m.74986 type:complete len:209 (+) Transcript_39128:474-1100(+)